MKILKFSLKNDAIWQWIYHLPLIILSLIGIVIIWLLSTE